MENTDRGLPYHLFLPAETALTPEDVFPNLRWGGRAIMVSPNELLVQEIARRFTRWEGFILEGQPQRARMPILGLSIPGLGKTFIVFRIACENLILNHLHSRRFIRQHTKAFQCSFPFGF